MNLDNFHQSCCLCKPLLEGINLCYLVAMTFTIILTLSKVLTSLSKWTRIVSRVFYQGRTWIAVLNVPSLYADYISVCMHACMCCWYICVWVDISVCVCMWVYDIRMCIDYISLHIYLHLIIYQCVCLCILRIYIYISMCIMNTYKYSQNFLIWHLWDQATAKLQIIPDGRNRPLKKHM